MRNAACPIRGIPALVLAVMLFASSAFGQQAWTSTPKAPHHNALVDITDFRYGGSGTVVHADTTDVYVVSCRHVVKTGTAVQITFPFGLKMRGVVVKDGGPDRDLCLIKCPHRFENWKDIIVIPVADKAPPAGQFVECTGYGVDGDGGDNLRHWVAKVHGYEHKTDEMIMQTSCVSGDSGGGVIFGGKLVGVIWGGKHRSTFDGKDHPKGMFVHPAHATNSYQIKKFLKGCIPWKPLNPGNGPAIPGPPPQGSVNPGSSGTYVTKPELDAALAPVQGKLAENKNLIVSLGSALAKLQAQLGTSQEAIAKAIAEAQAKAKAERDTLEGQLATKAEMDAAQLRHEMENNRQEGNRSRHKLGTVIEEIREKTAEAQDNGESKFGWINKPSTFISAAALLGLTGLPGIGVGVAGWFAIRRLKKRIGERSESGGSSPDPFDKGGSDPRLKGLRDKIERLQERLRNQPEDGSHPNDLSLIANLQARLETALAGEVSLAEQLEDARGHTQPLESKISELAADAVIAKSAIETLRIELAEAQEHTRTEYVHIPVTNQEAEAWKTAARRVAGKNPQAEPIVQLIQGVAEQIFHGAKVKAQDKRDPLKVG